MEHPSHTISYSASKKTGTDLHVLRGNTFLCVWVFETVMQESIPGTLPFMWKSEIDVYTSL